MPTRALSGARMVRDLGVTNEFLAPNVAAANKIQQVGSDRLLGRDIRSSGTGNSSQVQPWYDVQVPDWTTGAHITNWSTLQYYLSSVATTNDLIPATAVFVQFFGSVTQTSDMSLGFDGKLYMGPSGSANVTRIDPVTDTISVVNSSFVSNENQNFILHPNGNFYAFPYFGSSIRQYDPRANAVSVVGTINHGGSIPNLGGGTLLPNGKFVVWPYNQSGYALYSIVNLFDPTNGSVQAIHTVTGAVNGLYTDFSSVVAPNGKVYAFPAGSSNSIVLKIDPDNNSVSRIQTIAASSYSAISTAERIYLFNTSTLVQSIDPNNDIISTVGTILGAGSGKIYPVLHPNGNIYFAPFSGTSAHYYDPKTNTGSTLSQITQTFSSGYAGSAVSPQGNLYFAPFGATTIMKYNIITNNTWNLNVATNSIVNR